MKNLFAILALSFLACGESVSIPTLSMDVQVKSVPASTAATYLNLTIDGSTNGGDVIDVTSSSSQVQISLITPSSVEVTPANASGLGYDVAQQVVSAGSLPATGAFTPFDTPGAHTIFTLPSGTSAGVYQVKANSTSVGTATSLSAKYISRSGIRVGIAKDKLVYHSGDNVVLTALVFSGSTAVTGATVTAAVIPPVSISATIGNFQLISQTANGSFTQYTYQADLTNNSGTAFVSATAKLISLPDTVDSVGTQALGFSNLPTSGAVTSANTFTVQVDSNVTFNPATLQWEITVQGTTASVSMPDSGTYDNATGDGLYTGVYTPSATGTYQVLARVTGTYGGAAFSRAFASTFRAVDATATMSGVTDAAVDYDSNSLTDLLVLSAQLNVQTAGTYSFSVGLLASNGKKISASSSADLSTGSNQIDVVFRASQVIALGVDGPYEKVSATVLQLPASGAPIVAASIADAGATAAYTLASLDRGSIYFTDSNSATGIVTGAGPSYDILRVQIGINSPYENYCHWSGTLTDSAGDHVDNATGQVAVMGGSVSLTLDFSGMKIARSAGGPYRVTNVTVGCEGGHLSSDSLFSISGFTTSQFTSVTPDFTLALVGSAPSGAAGSSLAFPLQLSSTGDFDGNVTYSVSGLPSGATGTFSVPNAIGSGQTVLTVATSGALAPGSYAFTVGYSSSTASKTLPLTLALTP